MLEEAEWRVIMGLEGPVLDPAPGLITALRRALEDVGRPAPAAQDLHWALDADFSAAVRQLLGPTHAHLESAVAERFRKRYELGGRFQCRVHHPMARMLETFACRADIETVLISAQPRSEIDDQLARMHLLRAFNLVACTQHRACARCRRRLAAHLAQDSTHAGRCLWLSDDPDDIAAAVQAGITSIAALWGRSSPQELAASKPDLWAETPADLHAHLPTCGAWSGAVSTH